MSLNLSKLQQRSNEDAIDELRYVEFINQDILKQKVLLKRRMLQADDDLLQKYTIRKKIQMQSTTVVPHIQSLMCPICMDILVRPTTTLCGHNFCELCIFEGLLRKPLCPICRTNIRGQKFMFSLALESYIRRVVEQSPDENLKLTFQQRISENVDWNSERQLKDVVFGSTVDVLDTEHIWCVGTVLDVMKNHVLIHYQGWSKMYDEYLHLSSYRIAPKGFFTKRTDIPRYMPNESQDTLQNYIIQQSDGDEPADLMTTRLLSVLINRIQNNRTRPSVPSQPDTRIAESAIPMPFLLHVITNRQHQQDEVVEHLSIRQMLSGLMNRNPQPTQPNEGSVSESIGQFLINPPVFHDIVHSSIIQSPEHFVNDEFDLMIESLNPNDRQAESE